MGSRPGTASLKADYIRKNLVSSSTSPSHKDTVTALAWSFSGKRLATASMDGIVKVWIVSPDTIHSVSCQR
jgi:WD40 repeat protein